MKRRKRMKRWKVVLDQLELQLTSYSSPKGSTKHFSKSSTIKQLHLPILAPTILNVR